MSKGDKIYEEGQTVWVPHKDVGFTLGVVSQVAQNKLSVRIEEFDTTEDFDLSKEEIETVIVDKETLLKTQDLTRLPDLHRPSLLDALRQRFMKDHIYTYTGHILIGVNPFKELNFYSEVEMKKYSTNDDKTLLPPHVFYMANHAFKCMMNNDGQNQSILISGESGAGKTVTTKIVLDFLTYVTEKKEASSICNKVLKSNPVLEAFGNAKTLRNDNSSRFGKLILLDFLQNSQYKVELNGCKIDTYLLEKARVMNHTKGERNFHIFYELHEGLSEEEKDKLMMPHIEDSRLTNAHDRRVFRSDVSDADQWQKTVEAMKIVGLNQGEIETLKRIVVAVMHLGEISFVEKKGCADGSVEIVDYSESNVKSASELLEIDLEVLKEAFCSRTMTLGNKKQVMKKNNVAQAMEARNAIAMALYERMFLWLVWKTNKGMNVNASKKKERKVGKFMHSNVISVLDIFGFEVFQSNTFEQLFINYANEVLQQLFNEFVFKVEQQIYESERIDWTQIEFPDNSPTIDLIENKKQGILKLLDDECLLPKGSDAAFHDKLKKLVKNKKMISIDDNRQSMQKLFTIFHFAGAVEYGAYSFCMKNKNELRMEQINCIRSSKNEIIQFLLPADPNVASGAANANYFDEVEEEKRKLARGGKLKKQTLKSTQKLQQSTVGANFKAELNLAVEKIKASELHFIRCLKPNDENRPNDLDRKRVLEQLNYSGVLEAVRISRLGFSSRLLFKDFVQRFFVLLPTRQKKIKSSQNSDFKNQALDILENNSLNHKTDYQVGKTKVFLKSEAFNDLEALKRLKQMKSIITLQKNFKSFLFRLRMHRKIMERKKREEAERQKKMLEAKKKNLDTAAKQTEIKKVESKKYLPMRLVSDQDLANDPKLRYLNLHQEVPTSFDNSDILKVGTMRKKTRRVSKAKSRSKARQKARKKSEPSEMQVYIEGVMERLLTFDPDELSVDDAPVLIALVLILSLLVLNTTGVQLQMVANFFLMFILLSSFLMMIVQIKQSNDNKRMEVYKVNRRKSRVKPRHELIYFSDDEVMIAPLKRKKGGSVRSFRTMRTENSKNSKTRKRQTKRSKKRNLNGDIDLDEVDFNKSTADMILKKSSRNTKPADFTIKRKFTGMNVKPSRSTKASSASGKNSENTKRKTRYSGVNYQFP